MWGYLSEFWSSITQVVVDAGTYTVDWFQSVGNAVAGAIGNLFSFVLHFVNDISVLLGWVGTNFKDILLAFALPLQYLFTFLKNLFLSAFATPATPPTLYVFDPAILGIFDAIPYWSEISLVIGLSISVLFLFFILKTILKTR